MSLPRDDAAVFSRTPPQNVELEMCVLGAIMLEPKAGYPLAADLLRPTDFYLDGHEKIFRLMGELHDRGIPPDAGSMLDELRARGSLLDKVGGSGVLMGMLNSVPTAANLEWHAQKVAEKSKFRTLIRTCTKIVEDCYMQEKPLGDVLDSARFALEQLEAMGTDFDVTHIADAIEQTVSTVRERAAERQRQLDEGVRSPQVGEVVRTGFYALDDLLGGGLRKKRLTILAARPGEGKSALALNIADYAAGRDGHPVLLFSMEMGLDEIAERYTAMQTMHQEVVAGGYQAAGISAQRLAAGNVNTSEIELVERGLARIRNTPIFICDRGTLRISDIRPRTARAIRQLGIELVIVDYLQLITPAIGSRAGNKVADVTEISRGLKLLGQDFNVPVLALSQLSRQTEMRQNKRPQLSDLRESGAIEQDANSVVFIWRLPDKDQDLGLPKFQLLVDKNRGGPTGHVNVRWHGATTRFLPV